MGSCSDGVFLIPLAYLLARHNVATYLQSSDSTYLRNNLPEVMKHIQPIQLIDFGRAIDLSCLPKGTAFSSARSTEGFSCVEMLEDRPWSHQVCVVVVFYCQ